MHGTSKEDLLRDAAPLVRSTAARYLAKYQTWSLSFDDLFADGLYGALLAAESYNPDRGTAWTTWAFPYITRYMTLGVRFTLWETTRGDGGDVSSLDALRAAVSSTDGQIGDADWDLPDETLPDPDVGPIGTQVRRAVRDLDPQLRQIVYLSYWKDEGPTEVGRHLGMPKSTVRKRHAQALAELAGPLRPVAAA